MSWESLSRRFTISSGRSSATGNIEIGKTETLIEEDTTKAAALWILKTVLIQSLKLLHPYMRFHRGNLRNPQDEEPSIMISSWPEITRMSGISQTRRSCRDDRGMQSARSAASDIHERTAEQEGKVYVVSEDPEVLAIFEHSRVFFVTLLAMRARLSFRRTRADPQTMPYRL